MYRVFVIYLKFVLPAAVLLGFVLAARNVDLPWYVWFLLLPAGATALFLALAQVALRREQRRVAALRTAGQPLAPAPETVGEKGVRP